MHHKNEDALGRLQAACDLIGGASQLMNNADQYRKETGKDRYRLLAVTEYVQMMTTLIGLTVSMMDDRLLSFRAESQKYVYLNTEVTATMITADVHWLHVIESLRQSEKALSKVLHVVKQFVAEHIGEEEFK